MWGGGGLSGPKYLDFRSIFTVKKRPFFEKRLIAKTFATGCLWFVIQIINNVLRKTRLWYWLTYSFFSAVQAKCYLPQRERGKTKNGGGQVDFCLCSCLKVAPHPHPPRTHRKFFLLGLKIWIVFLHIFGHTSGQIEAGYPMQKCLNVFFPNTPPNKKNKKENAFLSLKLAPPPILLSF